MSDCEGSIGSGAGFFFKSLQKTDCRMCTSNGSCGMWGRKMQFPAQLGLQLPEKSC